MSLLLEAPEVGLTSARVVGTSVPRLDAWPKVRGEAVYVDDLHLPGMAYGKASRSPFPHARIHGIDVSEALALPGVLAVLTAADIPGKNLVGHRAAKNQPVLAVDRVRFLGEAVALVVAESPQVAAQGAMLVKVSYEPLPVIDDPAKALDPEAPLLHPDGNVCREIKVKRGNFEAALGEADLVVTNTFRTHCVDHACLEPDVAVAEPFGDGVSVWVGSRGVHADRGEIARVLGLSEEQVRVRSIAVGGSFGSKPEIATACMAALGAMKTGRPVKVALSREECFLAKVKRHPYVMTYTHAVAKNGRILGVKMRALADAGAYASASPSVVTKGIVHAAGPYRVPNVDMEIKAVYTNNPVAAGMRGYGVPQVVFGVERQMDIIACKLGMDPIELRLRNVLRPGDITATGQKVEHLCLAEALEMVRGRIGELTDSSVLGSGRRAWGVAAFFYGCGRTGVADSARVKLALDPGGIFRLFVGTPDTGQGSDTALAQIAAEGLGVPLEYVHMTSGDTELCQDAGTSTASRVTYIVGNAVMAGALSLRDRLLVAARECYGEVMDSLVADQLWLAQLAEWCRRNGVSLEAEGSFNSPTSRLDADGQGSPYGVYTSGVQATLVRVNTRTGKTDAERIVCCYDVGTVVNPALLEGQIEGGAAVALGYALTEDLGLRQGIPTNTNFDTYLLPTAADIPPIEVITVGAPDPSGPFGAKGVGEPAALPGAASIANGVSAALGVEITELPITPEKILACQLASQGATGEAVRSGCG